MHSYHTHAHTHTRTHVQIDAETGAVEDVWGDGRSCGHLVGDVGKRQVEGSKQG